MAAPSFEQLALPTPARNDIANSTRAVRKNICLVARIAFCARPVPPSNCPNLGSTVVVLRSKVASNRFHCAPADFQLRRNYLRLFSSDFRTLVRHARQPVTVALGVLSGPCHPAPERCFRRPKFSPSPQGHAHFPSRRYSEPGRRCCETD